MFVLVFSVVYVQYVPLEQKKSVNCTVEFSECLFMVSLLGT